MRSVAKSCPTVCDTIDCSLPGSSVCGILQARILEWVAISSSRDLPGSGIEPASPLSPALAGRFFTAGPHGKLLQNQAQEAAPGGGAEPECRCSPAGPLAAEPHLQAPGDRSPAKVSTMYAHGRNTQYPGAPNSSPGLNQC